MAQVIGASLLGGLGLLGLHLGGFLDDAWGWFWNRGITLRGWSLLVALLLAGGLAWAAWPRVDAWRRGVNENENEGSAGDGGPGLRTHDWLVLELLAKRDGGSIALDEIPVELGITHIRARSAVDRLRAEGLIHDPVPMVGDKPEYSLTERGRDLVVTVGLA